MYLLAGIQCKLLNVTRLPVIISQTPAGTSLENMQHFAQMVESNKFQKYDFGSPEENRKHYNQTTPPLYDLSTLMVPVSLFWGGEDWLADKEDVLQLIEKLHHVENSDYVPSYDHLGFMWALTAPEKIYNKILNIMAKSLQQ